MRARGARAGVRVEVKVGERAGVGVEVKVRARAAYPSTGVDLKRL